MAPTALGICGHWLTAPPPPPLHALLFPLLLVSPFCLKSSGQVNTVHSFSKPPCFWNLTLTVIRQLLRAPAANPFKCRSYAKSRAPTASQLLSPYLAAEAKVTCSTSMPFPHFCVSVGALSQGAHTTVLQEVHKNQESKSVSVSFISKLLFPPI